MITFNMYLIYFIILIKSLNSILILKTMNISKFIILFIIA